jgi:hypothetical protein
MLSISCGKKSDEIGIQADLPIKPDHRARAMTEEEIIELTREVSIFEADLKIETLDGVKTFISKKSITLKQLEHLQSLRFISEEISKVDYTTWGIIITPEPKEDGALPEAVVLDIGKRTDVKENRIKFEGKDILEDINWLSNNGAKKFKLSIILIDENSVGKRTKAVIVVPIENGAVGGGEDSLFGSEIKGPCTLQGDIRNFMIICEKPVKSFTIGFMTSDHCIINTGKINGVTHDLHVTNTGSWLIGYEKIASELNVAINFDDGTVALAKLSAR